MLTNIGDLRVQDDVLVRIRGRVVNVRDDEFLLRDRTGSVWVDAGRRVSLRVGEQVTVVGDFDDDDFDARRIIRTQPRNRSMARSSASDSGVGTDGKDGLTGISGRDSLHGQRSDDRLVGGSDRLTGGSSDRFVYQSIQDAGDIITDFNPMEDRLDLRQIFQQPQYASHDPFSDYLDLQQTRRGTAVRIDPDGDLGDANFTTLTTLTGVKNNQLNASQFQV
ncbi:MAG: type I secretion C-terminal target domain-containing protein [Leptolyngbya sp. DLM2.Bin15]|nr:MAG: type I secretion C-terminal target domain-containing protein [Leptolyngbya sp. DLM2.Bin15]